MPPSSTVYTLTSALESLDPWLTTHLPTLDPVARRRFIQLVTGIVEQQSLLLAAIAAGSPFQGQPTSNFTQVQRILQDNRLTLETTYYPLVAQVLAAAPGDALHLTVDQTNHGKDFNLVLVGWATDAVSLPLGFLVYAPDAPWAEDARTLLTRVAQVLPPTRTITVLADRAYASDLFLTCFATLGWHYVVRLPEDTQIRIRGRWTPIRAVRQRVARLRMFPNVRIWKGSTRRATVCLYGVRVADGTVHMWYIVTSLSGAKTRFVEYACRWWQECTHKLLKSARYNWELGRVTLPPRVTVLLMGFGAACWALWLLGRTHVSRPRLF